MIEYHELLAYVRERLEDDRAKSDIYDPLLTISPEGEQRLLWNHAYIIAKAEARKNNFEPLLKILTSRDPELADLIKGKPQPRRRSLIKNNISKANAYSEKRERADAVRRIREIIEDKIERQPSHERLIEIAAAVLECDPKEISRIIHRGKPCN
jgi:polyribonucleotide nucleotidyltransferase